MLWQFYICIYSAFIEMSLYLHNLWTHRVLSGKNSTHAENKKIAHQKSLYMPRIVRARTWISFSSELSLTRFRGSHRYYIYISLKRCQVIPLFFCFVIFLGNFFSWRHSFNITQSAFNPTSIQFNRYHCFSPTQFHSQLKWRTVYTGMKILAFVTDAAITIFRKLSTYRWLFSTSSPSTDTSPTTSNRSTISPARTTSASVVHMGASRTWKVGPRTVHRSGWTLEIIISHVIWAHHAVALLIIHGRWSHHSRRNHGPALHSLIKTTRHICHRVHSNVRHEDFTVARSPTATAGSRHRPRHLLRHGSHVRGSHHLLGHLRHGTHCRLGSHSRHHALLIVRICCRIVERCYGWWLRRLWLRFRPQHCCEVFLALFIAREIV